VAEERRPHRGALQAALRVALGVAGVAAIVLLVRRSGAEQLWATLVAAAPWLPLVIALEAGRMACDALALRAGHPELGRRVPLAALARGHLVGAALGAVLPAGRVVNEAMKGRALAPYVGGAAATAMVASNQAWMLIAGGLWSLPCAMAALVLTGPGLLSASLAAHAVGACLLGAGMRAASGSRRVGGWVGKRIQRLGDAAQRFGGIAREAPIFSARPIAAFCAGRALQAVEFGVLLLAVGVPVVGAAQALLGQGILIVAAAVGLFVPGQLGAHEGAFSFWAADLGADAAMALAVPLLARVAQIFWVAVGAAVAVVWPLPRVVGGGELEGQAGSAGGRGAAAGETGSAR
jgi:hypothetical protein